MPALCHGREQAQQGAPTTAGGRCMVTCPTHAACRSRSSASPTTSGVSFKRDCRFRSCHGERKTGQSTRNHMSDRDLVALWEAHCRYEFETRDVDATMATMIDTPYVNHVPTMTGGVGYDQLKRFYKYHFIGGNPDDTQLIPISRTVGK